MVKKVSAHLRAQKFLDSSLAEVWKIIDLLIGGLMELLDSLGEETSTEKAVFLIPEGPPDDVVVASQSKLAVGARRLALVDRPSAGGGSCRLASASRLIWLAVAQCEGRQVSIRHAGHQLVEVQWTCSPHAALLRLCYAAQKLEAQR